MKKSFGVLPNGEKAGFVINKSKTYFKIFQQNGVLHYNLRINISCDIDDVSGASDSEAYASSLSDAPVIADGDAADDGADDGNHAKHECEAGEKALMIVINRKRGARLASVCVFGLCFDINYHAFA